MKKEQIKYYAKMGAESFMDDPLYVKCIPDRKKRSKILYHLMMFRLYASYESDIIIEDEKKRGLCIWRQADKDYSFKDTFKYIKIIPAVIRYLPYAVKILYFAASTDSSVFEKNTMIISPIFVGKEFRNHRVASKLIMLKINELESSGFECALETQNEKNVGFYEKLGFSVIKTDYIEKYGFYNFYMLRQKDN